MPECNEGKIAFGWVGRRVIEGGFNGGDLSSDGGLMLLKRTDERIGLTRAVAAVLSERRDPDLPQHLLLAPAPKAPAHGLVVRMGLARSIVEATVTRGATPYRTSRPGLRPSGSGPQEASSNRRVGLQGQWPPRAARSDPKTADRQRLAGCCGCSDAPSGNAGARASSMRSGCSRTVRPCSAATARAKARLSPV